jgi:hypothetical protein
VHAYRSGVAICQYRAIMLFGKSAREATRVPSSRDSRKPFKIVALLYTHYADSSSARKKFADGRARIFRSIRAPVSLK